jgi:hypothetical protein
MQTIIFFFCKQDSVITDAFGQWGLQSCTYSPHPDFMTADKTINLERILQKPVMPFSQAATDTEQHQEVDNFYLVCTRKSCPCA